MNRDPAEIDNDLPEGFAICVAFLLGFVGLAAAVAKWFV